MVWLMDARFQLLLVSPWSNIESSSSNQSKCTDWCSAVTLGWLITVRCCHPSAQVLTCISLDGGRISVSNIMEDSLKYFFLFFYPSEVLLCKVLGFFERANNQRWLLQSVLSNHNPKENVWPGAFFPPPSPISSFAVGWLKMQIDAQFEKQPAAVSCKRQLSLTPHFINV